MLYNTPMDKIGTLECLVVEPPETRSTLILMHGRGTSPDDLAPMAQRLPEGMAAILPQAPFPFPPEMPFGRAWYGMPPEQEEAVRESAGYLKELLDAVTEQDPAKAERVVLGGFSQGGVMALDVGLTYRPRLAGVVCMSGYLFPASTLPSSSSDAPPVCITHGREDEVVDVQRARKSRQALEEQGIASEYAEFDIPHTISEESWAFVSNFLQRVLR